MMQGDKYMGFFGICGFFGFTNPKFSVYRYLLKQNIGNRYLKIHYTYMVVLF